MTLKAPVDWRVGDEVVVVTTGDRHSQRENEKRKISGQLRAGDFDKCTWVSFAARPLGHAELIR